MKERRTRQLAAVYEVVSRARDHPSAEVVCRRVRGMLPNVSLGTVYRNLQKLVAQRRIRVVQLANRATRYDGMLEEHDHFMCERCGCVTDLLRPRPESASCSDLVRAGYAVHTRAVTLYGVCPPCRDRDAAGRRAAS
jgi:Fe2+ or Zn2+ uptake regulation protein